ncbi:MAG: hypothetical protein EOO39_19445 [Cytophagaceae bacterium]|nr:MAG: hypothetical protein EOO39_19445 [Cytophagaceae bacterium]
MSSGKIISIINWLLISIYGLYVLYYLFQPNGPTDAAGQGLESAVKGTFVFLLLLLIGLTLLPYQWTKIIGLILGILLVLLVIYIRTH